jgi:hypothetical protein
MFYIDFLGFTNDPLHLGYNSTGQENHVLCIFLTFRDLNEVKLSYDFGDVNISSREASGALGLTRWARRSKKGKMARPGRECMPPPLFSSSVLRFA